jgi:hypothetical protein
MTISTFLDPNEMPDQTQDQTVFDNKLGAVYRKLPMFGAEVNATAAEMNATLASANAEQAAILAAANSMAAGGGMSLEYVFDTATADADPTAGKLRLNNSTQNAATAIRLDLLGADTNDYTSLLDNFDASTSIEKGLITLRKKGDPRKFLTFSLTAKASPSGYRNLTVACIGGSAANPFANGDTLVLQFTRTGNQGLQGASYLTLRVREEYASGSSGAAGGAAGTYTTTITRVLNTTKTNTISGASLASNQITLPAGQYEVDASAYISPQGPHRAYLYCVTDSSIVALGVMGPNNCALVKGEFTIASAKVYELRHYINNGSGSFGYSLGLAVSQSGQPEVYTDLTLRKLA